MRARTVVLAALGLALALPASAQQLDFKRSSRSGDDLLSYKWRDHERREHSLAFTITKEEIRKAESSFMEFSLDGMWRLVEAGIRDEVAKFGQSAEVKFTRTADGISWNIGARDRASVDTLMARAQARHERTQSEYLKRHQRRVYAGRLIAVDYAAATTALRDPLRAVPRALGDVRGIVGNDRARAALALSFFQSIPYALLEDKVRKGGDFLPGPALLAQNRGDCDSKAVALAAVLRAFTPSRKLAMIVMPGHAVLGIDLDAQQGDQVVRGANRNWVALEAAGPGLLSPGRVGTDTAKLLATGRGVEVWPLN